MQNKRLLSGMGLSVAIHVALIASMAHIFHLFKTKTDRSVHIVMVQLQPSITSVHRVLSEKVNEQSLTSAKQIPNAAQLAELDPYYASVDLDQPIQVLIDTTADLNLALSKPITFQLFINREGDIDRVLTDREILPPTHAQEILSAVEKMRFIPCMRSQRQVKCQMLIELSAGR